MRIEDTPFPRHKQEGDEHTKRRVKLHLTPFFGGRRPASITTPLIRESVAARQATKAANGQINRELACLKRMYSLAIQAGKLYALSWVFHRNAKWIRDFRAAWDTARRARPPAARAASRTTSAEPPSVT